MTHPKRLVKSKKDRIIAGVCAGLADYLDIDPTVVRIFFVVLAVFGGSGVLLYFILWLFIPSEGQGKDATQGEIFQDNLDDIHHKVNDFTHKMERVDKKYFPGAALIFLGVLILLINFGFLRTEYILPIIFVSLGTYLIFRK